jgi:glyoxylate reductase
MTDRPVVYVTREIPEVGIDLLEEECEVHVREEKLPPDRDELLAALRELEPDGLLCLLTEEIDGAVLDASPNLRALSTLSVGYDHIDMDAVAERGLPVGHTPGVLGETTADFAWALLMTAARRTVEGHEYVLGGEWETWGPKLLTGPDVHDATLGIVGLGDIGTRVARRAGGFRMDVVYTATGPHAEREAALAEHGVDAEYVDLPDLLERSDFVSVHTPLTEETEGLIDADALARMKEGAVLVNTARGPIVDTDALDAALADGEIARAGLDVTDPEPLPADHEILRHAPERLVVAPHIGSASIGTRDEMSRMAAENLLAGLRGEALPNDALADRADG